jgi:hypothetical protein
MHRAAPAREFFEAPSFGRVGVGHRSGVRRIARAPLLQTMRPGGMMCSPPAPARFAVRYRNSFRIRIRGKPLITDAVSAAFRNPARSNRARVPT